MILLVHGCGTDARRYDDDIPSVCPCGKAVESITHTVGECEICMEEPDLIEGDMRNIDECDMEKFGTIDSSEKTIAMRR